MNSCIFAILAASIIFDIVISSSDSPYAIFSFIVNENKDGS